jgi:hypothetical protein
MVTKVPAEIVVPDDESTQGSETIVKIVLPPLNEPLDKSTTYSELYV